MTRRSFGDVQRTGADIGRAGSAVEEQGAIASKVRYVAILTPIPDTLFGQRSRRRSLEVCVAGCSLRLRVRQEQAGDHL